MNRIIDSIGATPALISLVDPLKGYISRMNFSFDTKSTQATTESNSGNHVLNREAMILIQRQQPFIPDEDKQLIVDCVTSQRNLSVCDTFLFERGRTKVSPSSARVRMETMIYRLRENIISQQNELKESEEEENEDDHSSNEVIVTYERLINFIFNSGQVLYLSNQWVGLRSPKSKKVKISSAKKKKRRSSNLSSVFNEEEQRKLHDEFEEKEEKLRKQRKQLNKKRKKKRKSNSSVGERSVVMGNDGPEMNEKELFEALQYARKRRVILVRYLRKVLIEDNNNPKKVALCARMFNNDHPEEVPSNKKELSDVIDHYKDKLFRIIERSKLGEKKAGVSRFRLGVEKFNLIEKYLSSSPDPIFEREDTNFREDLEVLEGGDDEEQDDLEASYEYDSDGRRVRRKKDLDEKALEDRLLKWKKLQEQLRYGNRSTQEEEERIPKDGKGSIFWWKTQGVKRTLSTPPFQFLRAKEHYQSFPYKI